MNILIEAGFIPAEKYGGTNRVTFSLGKALSQLGHNVIFLATKGSTCNFAKIIERDPQKNILNQIPQNIDVVHFNFQNSFLDDNEIEACEKPYISTIHGNIKSSGKLLKNTVFVSQNHAARYDSNSFVYNGLDWDTYGKADLTKQRTLYHFLGKAAWKVKNIKGAIDIVKRLPDAHLEVLGGYRLNFKMGFRFTLDPHIHFHGMVNNAVKKEIIERSRGLIFPVRWHEPFGLAVIESLYFGAPIFATPYGSMTELITSHSKKIGFLSNNMHEIIEHIKNQGENYSPRICHDVAIDLFSAKKMAKAYLKKYEIVLNGKTLNDANPVSTGENFRNLTWITDQKI